MNKITWGTTLFLFAMTSNATDLSQELGTCATIKSDSSRLQCYDKLAANMNRVSTDSKQLMIEDIGREREREKKRQEASEEVYEVTVTDCVRSSASNRVSFTLENGQIWRQKNSRWLSLRDCTGKAIIKSGYFGYTIYIEALNQTIGVIRAD